MAALPGDLLKRPAVESVRLIALHYLDAAAAALTRLADPADQEALHDFRVGVRRLRSTIRAYRRELRGSVNRKVRNRLREVAVATNRGRDAEVALIWLRPLADEFTARERSGLRWLIEWLERLRADVGKRVLAQVPRSFTKVEQRLRKDLAEYRREVADLAQPDVRFGAVARSALEAQATQLDKLLAAVQAADEHEAIHRARIGAKRLRYLLEPIVERLPDGPALLGQLKSLQDLVGELCDVRVLEDMLRSAVEAAGADRATALYDEAITDPSPSAPTRGRRWNEQTGLLAVGRRLSSRRLALFAKFKTTWLGGENEFSNAIAIMVGELEAMPAAAAQPIVLPVPVPVPPRRPMGSRPTSM